MLNAHQQLASPTTQQTLTTTDIHQHSPQKDQTTSLKDNNFWKWIKLNQSKILAIILALQAIWSLFNSLRFIFVKLPALENQLAAHTITQNKINDLANRAILDLISTMLNLFFAIRLTVIQTPIMKKISRLVAILLIIGNTQINLILNQIGSGQLITTMVLKIVRSFFKLEKQLTPDF